MKPKVLVTHQTFPEVLAFLRPRAVLEMPQAAYAYSKKQILDKISDKEGLLCLLTDTIGRELIDAAPDLKIIANCAAGTDNIDLEYASRKGILVTNTPGVLTETTAELTMALILAVARRILPADEFSRKKKFKGWKLDLFLGKDLRGLRLGILGLGRIGKAVARLARSFGMEIVYHDPHPLPEAAEKRLQASRLSLDHLLRSSDIVSIHASLTPKSRHLLSRDKIRLMKKGAILINIARGPIVDEKALAEALTEKKLWGAGLDVYEREPEIEEGLIKLDNVVLLPHIGSATIETRLRMAMTAARNLVQGLRGERPDNLVGESRKEKL